MKLAVILPLVLVLAVASQYLQAQDQKVIEFKIEGLSCGACTNSAQSALIKMKGVDKATVDFDSKKAVVYASGDVDEEKIKKVINDMNFEALFDEDQLPEPLSAEELKSVDMKTIKGGKKINFEKHLADNKLTIFDFYTDWCGPCKVFSPKLENLLRNNKNIALRKVDVVDWKSEVAKQLTKDYKLPSLPFTLIFNDQSELIGKVEGNDIEAVELIIK